MSRLSRTPLVKLKSSIGDENVGRVAAEGEPLRLGQGKEGAVEALRTDKALRKATEGAVRAIAGAA